MANINTNNLVVRISQHLREALERAAKAQGVRVADVARERLANGEAELARMPKAGRPKVGKEDE